MSTIAKAAGVGDWIQINANTYPTTPLGPIDFAEASAFLRSRSPDPVEETKKHLDGLAIEVQKVMMLKAMDDKKGWGSLTTPDGQRWAVSIEGLAFWVWRLVVKKTPNKTFDDIFGEMKLHFLNFASEIDARKDVYGKINARSGMKADPSKRGTTPRKAKRSPNRPKKSR